LSITWSLNPVDFLSAWGGAGNRPLFLLTGASGVGKTTWCMLLAREAAAIGRQVSGVCSPAVFENGDKIAIDLLNLNNSERRRLARRRPPVLEDGAEATLHWQFDEQVLRWGNSLLLRKTHDIFLLDELGPLEFERRQGLMNAFEVLDGNRFNMACVVVRPSLLMEAQDRWPAARLLDIGEVRA